jgi:GrpB-like predicted nucleotidyltransferase (UPF0157 family)
VAIEHIGSTAVPGLPAKPVIDVVVGVPQVLDGARYAERVAPLGYSYRPEREAQHPDRRFFSRQEDGVWSHHLHIVKHGGARWTRLLLFRDYLREHPAAVERYAAAKRAAADAAGEDIAAYRAGKEEIVRTLLAEAEQYEQRRMGPRAVHHPPGSADHRPSS